VETKSLDSKIGDAISEWRTKRGRYNREINSLNKEGGRPETVEGGVISEWCYHRERTKRGPLYM
jgi:hypothetical protein